MESDTDCLPQLEDDPDEFIDTIVLEDSDIMETREMRQLLDPDTYPPEPGSGHGDTAENDEQ